MAKLRFIVVGSGWRSLFYWRIAQALPERFELCAMLCRTEEKAEKMHREYGVPVSTSAEQCIALHPDFVVVAVNKASIAAVSTEWLGRGFAVLCETPAALEEDALRALWQLHQQGAKLQVAEQYWLVPHAGKTAGSSAQRRTGHAAVCPAVGGARLPRGQSGAAVPECRAAAGAGDRTQLDGKDHRNGFPLGRGA